MKESQGTYMSYLTGEHGAHRHARMMGVWMCQETPRIAGLPEVRRKGWNRFSSKPLGGTNLPTP